MKLKPLMTAAALAATTAVAGLSAASAQSVVLTYAGSAPAFTYDYAVTLGATASKSIEFSFSDPNVTAVTAASYSDGDGDFTFSAPGKTMYTADKTYMFDFTSADPKAADGVDVSVKATAVSASGPLAPTPEPSAMVSMSILGACLGLGILAKRRKVTAN